MPTFVIILVVLGAGLYVGSQLSSAREAHLHFTSHRHRTALDLTAWIRHAVVAVLSIAALLLLLYFLLVQFLDR